jgi:hypothetical protein
MSDRSNKVVHLSTRRRPQAPSTLKIWACACGSMSFFLYSDGSVQCTECRNYSRKISCSAAVKAVDES